MMVNERVLNVTDRLYVIKKLQKERKKKLQRKRKNLEEQKPSVKYEDEAEMA